MASSCWLGLSWLPASCCMWPKWSFYPLIKDGAFGGEICNLANCEWYKLISDGSFEAITNVPRAVSIPPWCKTYHVKSWLAHFTPFASYVPSEGTFGCLVKRVKMNCEWRPESTTAFPCASLQGAGWSNQVYVQFVLGSPVCTKLFTPRDFYLYPCNEPHLSYICFYKMLHSNANTGRYSGWPMSSKKNLSLVCEMLVSQDCSW